MYGPPYRDIYRGCLYQECKAARASLNNVHLLLQARCDPRIRHEGDLNGPLHLACRHCNLRLCKMLRKAGADPRQVNGLGQTALGVACCFNCPKPRRREHLKLVEWLLDNGAPPNHADKGGHTALDLAASWNNLPVVALLIRRGALVTRSKWTLQTAEGEDTRALVAAKERSELQELRKRKEERRQAEEEKDRLQKEADRRESMVKQVKERQTKRKEALLASTSAKRPPKLPPEQPLVIRRERAKDGVWIKCSSGHWRLATEDEVVADSSNALREASIMYRDAENSRLRELAQVRWRALTTTTH